MSVLVSKKCLCEIKYLCHSLVWVQARGSCWGGWGATELTQLGKAEVGTEECVLAQLKQWATLTSTHYGLKVNNLTLLHDTQVMCLLLHHYCLALLPHDLVHRDTTKNIPSPEVSADKFLQDDTSERHTHAECLANDMTNSILFMDKVSQLDRMPLLVYLVDTINTSVITHVLKNRQTCLELAMRHYIYTQRGVAGD